MVRWLVVVWGLVTGCASGLQAYGVHEKKPVRVALFFETLEVDQFAARFERRYPVWVQQLASEAYDEVVPIQYLHQMASVQADLVLKIRLTQGTSLFYIDHGATLNVQGRGGEVLFEGTHDASSWNWWGNANDYSGAVEDVMAPLLAQGYRASEVHAYLQRPMPEFAHQFVVPPPAPHPKPMKKPTGTYEKPAPPVVFREASPPPRLPLSSSRPIVAVFALQASGFSMRASRRVRLHDYLSTQLAATGRFEVVPAGEVRDSLLKAKASSYQACYDEACQIELGKELAAEKSLGVKVLKLGAKCTVLLNLYDLKKATLESAASAKEACSDEGLVAALDQALEAL